MHLIVTLVLFLAGLVLKLPVCDSELGFLAVYHLFGGNGVNLQGFFLFGLVIFDLVGFAGLALQASPYLLLIFVVIEWYFLMATRRDALNEPTYLVIDSIDLLEILALFGLKWRMLMPPLIEKRMTLPLLPLLSLLSYGWATFIFCSSKLLRSEKEGSRYLMAQPRPKVSPR